MRQVIRHLNVLLVLTLLMCWSFPAAAMVPSADPVPNADLYPDTPASLAARQFMPLRPDLLDGYSDQVSTPQNAITKDGLPDEYRKEKSGTKSEAAPFSLDGSVKPDLGSGIYRTPQLDPSGRLLAPQIGVRKTLVIMLQFQDVKFGTGHNAAYYNNMLFGPSNSLASYYYDQSYGQMSVTGTVLGPYTSDHSISYYAGDQNALLGSSIDTGMAGTPVYIFEMAREAVIKAKAANPSFGWGQYDTDGDGALDAVTIIHAGAGQEESDDTLDDTTIWSHAWNIYNNLDSEGNISGDQGEPVGTRGKVVFGYNTVPETGQLGVFCHEFGHVLGLPDLYDPNYEIVGAGYWDLMASGSWNSLSVPGDCPAGLSAWCRHYLGWLNYTTVTQDALNTEIPDTTDNAFALQLWTDGIPGVTHYLVENRQQKRFDQALPGEGLLVWWVNDPDPWVDSNIVNTNPPTVMPIEADGLWTLWEAYGYNQGDAGDPFPGSTNNTSFTYTSNPDSTGAGGAYTAVSLWNIHNDTADPDLMVADVTVNNGLLLEPDANIPYTVNLGPITTFEYTLLNDNTTVSIDVLDGDTSIKLLADQVVQNQGLHSINWNETNTAGQLLPLGTYTIRITAAVTNSSYSAPTSAAEVFLTNFDIIESGPISYGDTNEDSSINITDAVSVLKYITSPTQCINVVAGDVNGDNTINITDAVLVLKHITNPNAPFPVE